MRADTCLEPCVKGPFARSPPLSGCVHAQVDNVVRAYIVMADIVMAYTDMAYLIMAYIVMAYIVMTYILMAYEVSSHRSLWMCA